jgi:hypothetical protein
MDKRPVGLNSIDELNDDEFHLASVTVCCLGKTSTPATTVIIAVLICIQTGKISQQTTFNGASSAVQTRP